MTTAEQVAIDLEEAVQRALEPFRDHLVTPRMLDDMGAVLFETISRVFQIHGLNADDLHSTPRLEMRGSTLHLVGGPQLLAWIREQFGER